MNQDTAQPTTLRLPPSSVAARRRWTAGLTTSLAGLVSGAIVESSGTGLSARTEVVATSEVALPEAVTHVLRELCLSERGSLSLLSALPAQLIPTQCEVIDALLAEARVAREDVIALGVDDPGIWDVDGDHRCYVGLCDAARLAEISGMNVIDALPARDVGSGGLGGPVTALAEWLLLAEQRRPSIVLHLDQSIYATILPPRLASGDVTKNLASLEIGPGLDLLSRLTKTEKVSESKGECVPELLAEWLTNPLLQGSQPRWHPRGVSIESFLNQAVSSMPAGKRSLQNALCTAKHLVAEATHKTVRSRFDEKTALGNLIYTGPGQDDAALLEALEERFPDTPQIRAAEMGMAGRTLTAAGIALLALLHIDQVPATQTSTTRIMVPRVLGRLTPGVPQNWHKLLAQAAEARPQVMSLRSAL